MGCMSTDDGHVGFNVRKQDVNLAAVWSPCAALPKPGNTTNEQQILAVFFFCKNTNSFNLVRQLVINEQPNASEMSVHCKIKNI